VENYFNYFNEIEEHFQKRRGSILLLSTLDWVLIESWKDSGIPLEAALHGIDTAFEHYENRRSKTRKVNSLAYCSQEVLAAAEDMKEAAVGAAGNGTKPAPFGNAEIVAFLRRCSAELLAAKLPEKAGISANAVAKDAAGSLGTMASEIEAKPDFPRLEDLERHLTVLEQTLFAVLLAATPDDDLVAIRSEADRELAPYRRKMSGAQIEQLHKQYVHKRLLEKFKLPRLSLFYL
jgi:hypothetical protein